MEVWRAGVARGLMGRRWWSGYLEEDWSRGLLAHVLVHQVPTVSLVATQSLLDHSGVRENSSPGGGPDDENDPLTS